MNEKPSPEEIEQGLRTGYSFAPGTPGLQEAARQLIRPIIEKMDGREIIYECHFPWLMRVAYLEIDDRGFRAVGMPTPEPENQIMSFPNQIRSWKTLRLDPKPLDFGFRWEFLRMSGSAICTTVTADCFHPDEEVVAEIKAALARKDIGEILAILRRASSKR